MLISLITTGLESTIEVGVMTMTCSSSVSAQKEEKHFCFECPTRIRQRCEKGGGCPYVGRS